MSTNMNILSRNKNNKKEFTMKKVIKSKAKDFEEGKFPRGNEARS